MTQDTKPQPLIDFSQCAEIIEAQERSKKLLHDYLTNGDLEKMVPEHRILAENLRKKSK